MTTTTKTATASTITTIRRNSKLGVSILAGKGVKSVQSYSLGNGFSGGDVAVERFAELMAANIAMGLDMKITTSTATAGVYTVTMHSNHWYEVRI